MPGSILRLILAAAAPVLAAGCSSATAPSSGVLDVTVTAGRSSFVHGDTVHLTVHVTNPTSSSVTVSGSSSSLLAFRALDAQGRVVAGSDRVSTADLIRRTVGPGATISQTIIWNGSEASGIGTPALLPEGEYRIVGVLNAIEGERVSQPRRMEIQVP